MFGVPTAAGAPRRRHGARRRSRCARPACSTRLRAARRARRQPLRPLALPLPRRSRPPAGPQRRGGGLRGARGRGRDDARAARRLHHRARRRLHAGGGHGGGARAAPWASPWASSTSTPTPTSTRPRPRPPGYLNGMALALALGRGPRRWWPPPGRRARASRPITWRWSASAPLDPGERPAAGRPRPRPARRAPRAAWGCAWRRPSPWTASPTATAPSSSTSTSTSSTPRRCRPSSSSRPGRASPRRGLGPRSPRSLASPARGRAAR